VRFYFEPPHVKLTYLAVAALLAVIVFEYVLPLPVHQKIRDRAMSAGHRALSADWR
jgi:hypothetical protein